VLTGASQMAGLVKLRRSIAHIGQRRLWAGQVQIGGHCLQVCTVRYC